MVQCVWHTSITTGCAVRCSAPSTVCPLCCCWMLAALSPFHPLPSGRFAMTTWHCHSRPVSASFMGFSQLQVCGNSTQEIYHHSLPLCDFIFMRLHAKILLYRPPASLHTKVYSILTCLFKFLSYHCHHFDTALITGWQLAKLQNCMVHVYKIF